MDLKQWTIDAFAAQVFEGNPAAIVPLADWLDDRLMQVDTRIDLLSAATDRGFRRANGGIVASSRAFPWRNALKSCLMRCVLTKRRTRTVQLSWLFLCCLPKKTFILSA